MYVCTGENLITVMINEHSNDLNSRPSKILLCIHIILLSPLTLVHRFTQIFSRIGSGTKIHQDISQDRYLNKNRLTFILPVGGNNLDEAGVKFTN